MERESSDAQCADVARRLGSKFAVKIFDGCDHASLSLLGKRNRIINRAQTDDQAAAADRLQVELDGGPCVQAAVHREVVHVADVLAEKRWPAWTAAVARDVGLRSVLALSLYVDHRPLGALNLYSQTVDAFSVDDQTSAEAFAAHVAVAVAAAQYEQQTETAMAHRLVVGQAEGMLMQGLGITADQASRR